MSAPVAARYEAALRAIADDKEHEPGGAYQVTFDAKGKLQLPPTPSVEDIAGLCAWLTVVFSLDPAHPITRAVHEGLIGKDGHVVLHRAGDAGPIRFEPAAHINQPARLIETLSWRLGPQDGAVHAFKGDHCRVISHVIRMACGAFETASDADEAAGIVGTFLHIAVAVDGRTTYGTPAQRYEAALGLRHETDEIHGRPVGPPRYLIDANTGELVIGVRDLAEAARHHVGSGLARGWLDARMATLGWARVTLQGYGHPGRAGRQDPHARINAYRGHLPAGDQGDQDTVNT